MSYNSTEDGPSGEIITNDNSSVSKHLNNEPIENEREPARSEESNDSESQPLIRGRLLSPDDPLVSPKNLYHVRIVEYIIWGLWLINCVFFFILLLSDFVAIPGLNNRGRSFLEIDLVILCGLTNLLTMCYFVVPAYFERILGYVTGGLLVIDILVSISVTYLRHQFGALGNLLMLWTLFNVLFNCYADYTVENAKRYQEIRYTGRPETRKTFFEAIIITFKFLIKLVLLVLVWNISLSLWLMAFDTHEAPMGKMVPVNNEQFKIHLNCYGDMHNGTQPIVLVEGGQQTSSEEFSVWVEEAYNLNQIERYCIYDRPGHAFSDSAPLPVSISIIVDYLNEALSSEGIDGPFVLLGFDIGGLYSRLFAFKNPSSVKLIMLVDSWHEDLLKLKPFPKPEPRKFKEFELMTTGTGFKLWFRGLVSPLGLVTNLHWFLHPKKYSSKARIYGPDMVHQPQYLRARLQEQITSQLLSFNEVAGAHLEDIPIYVVSSDEMIKKSRNWGNWQRQLTKISSDSREWTIAEKSSHFIWESKIGKQTLQETLLRAATDK